jgi:stage IV sporulation protein A
MLIATPKTDIYGDIALRTGGDIYIGVVGPVRTGKSTFIKKFMENLVIPNITDEYKKERANDELPQSSGGRTIMTTEPKFIPEEAVLVELEDGAKFNVRMLDCVGYLVPSAVGYIENEQPRMVKTPWFDTEVPFNMAAEFGTKKVITEHSTIGLVITSDGSISGIPREEYEEAEERVIGELKEIGKPFVIVLNSVNPDSAEVKALAEELTEKYGTAVIPINCLDLDADKIKNIITQVLFEFPIREINVKTATWLNSLEKGHWLKDSVFSCIRDAAKPIKCVREIKTVMPLISDNEFVSDVKISEIELGTGAITIEVVLRPDLFYKILGETTGIEIENEGDLLPLLLELAKVKKAYDKIKPALDEVEATGYGIVMPTTEELMLEEPEIIKQGGKYGVRLKASAPSIHLMKASINTTVSPIVGSEKQSEDLVMYLLKEFEENPKKIWESNIFGKSLYELVNEGLHNKLYRMPIDARMKIGETLERIINDGCNGLICFIL